MHKIQAVFEWPRLVNEKQLGGFLGFTRYYRRFFFFGYASVATPLSDLLKKEAFIWSLKAKS